MNSTPIQSTIMTLLLLFSMVCQAQKSFDDNRPNGISNDKWSNLKAIVQESLLLPSSDGLSGPNSLLGTSVSVEGDRALVGAPGTAGSGAVYVLDFDGKSWLETAVLTPSDGLTNNNFGISVSLSGNRALVGTRFQDPDGFLSQIGSAYVFELVGTSWVETTKLTAADGALNDQFGLSVSLSNNRALIGREGSAYVFDLTAGSWTETTKLTVAEVDDSFGYSISLSSDRALVGAPADDETGFNSGAAYVFDLGAGSWTETAKLTVAEADAGDSFGYSISLSGDRALVGAPFDDDNGSNAGSAYVFDLVAGNWTETAKLTATDGTINDQFGRSISLDGNRALVGVVGDDDNGSLSGSAYIFESIAGGWVETFKFTATDGAVNDSFGHVVSLNDGRALVGAPFDDDSSSNSGSTYVFNLEANNWTESVKLTDAVGAVDDKFGWSVSLDGDRALVGAPFDDDNGSNSGAAYVFDLIAGSWSETAKLTVAEAGDSFGRSISLEGDRALVGAPFDDDNGSNSGAAYVFDLVAGSWTETAKLTVAEAGDSFGRSISLEGDRALVGAPFDDDNGSNSGAAYIFDLVAGDWTETAKLTAAEAEAGDSFGYSISLSGDRVLIGAPFDDDNGSSSGSAYLFALVLGSWAETFKFTANDGATFDTFGSSVSLNGDRVLVGAPGNDDTGDLSGSAYLFDLIAGNWTETAKLNAADGAANNQFGHSVSLDDNRALVGAVSLELGNLTTGSGYVFDLVEDTWTETTKLIAVIDEVDDQFGYAVSLSGDRALVGAIGDDDRGTDSGSASVFLIDVLFTVAVDVSGLAAGNSVELLNNGGDNLLLNSNGLAEFDTPLFDGDTYAVTVSTQPLNPNQTCVVSNPTGTINDEDLTLAVTCTINPYEVIVDVTGLAGNGLSFSNGDDNLVFTSDGMQTISTLDDGSTYNVNITSQPTSPNQLCNFSNANSGTLNGTNHTIIVTCETLEYSIGGTVTGLADGNFVTLTINAGDEFLVINNNSAFTFINPLFDLSTYAVSVLSQPLSPNQTCVVEQGKGTLMGVDVTDIAVTCITTQYDLIIDVTGLTGTGLSFSNGDDNLVFTTDGMQTISTLDDGSTYDVNLTGQPTSPNQICSFSNPNSGTLNGANQIINITCETIEYSIGGTVTGLASGNFVTLSINSGETLLADNNSSFVFPDSLLDGSAYAVTVLSQPTSPNQTCIVNQGDGVLMGADVTDITVNCTINQYFIGGFVNGLLPDNFMVLQNNLTDDSVVTDDGAFVINAPIDDQQNYSVSILSQPDNPIQSCQLFNPTGSVDGNDVTDVLVICEFGDDLIYRHGFDGPDAISRTLWESDQ